MLIPCVFLAAALWLIYGRALNSPFVFDDTLSVIGNRSIVRFWPWIGGLYRGGPLNPPNDLPTSGRPLVNLSLALNYHFGQLDPTGYHFFNLIVHLLSALLLFGIVRRTLQLSFFGAKFEEISGLLAFFAALLWAVHPLQTETVVYTTQRTELLVGFFYLATLYCSLRYWEAFSRAVRIAWLTAATLACLGGVACKEVMVSAPLIVLLFERTFIAGSFGQALRKSWPLYVGLFLSWGLLLALNANAPRSDSAGFHLGVPASDWWFTQAKVLWIYFGLTIWPWPLSIHYEMPYLTSFAAAWPWVVPTVLVAIAVLLLLWRRSAIGFVGIWVFAILAPTMIVPVVTEVAAERRMYLPTAALSALVVVGGYLLCERAARLMASRRQDVSISRRPLAIVGACTFTVAIMFSAVSAYRLMAFQNPIALWQSVLESQPDNSVAHNNLAAVLNDAGRWQESIPESAAALQRNPDYPSAYYNLGLALNKTGHSAEAITQYQQALKLKPNYPEAFNNLGNIYLNSGQPMQAIECYQRALQLDPEFVNAQTNWGAALVRLGKPEEAITHYRLALRLSPDSPEGYCNLALALAGTNNFDEAFSQLGEALRLEPNSAATYAIRARVYARMNRFADAIASAEKALTLARAGGQTILAEQIDASLASYRANQSNAPSAPPGNEDSTAK